MSKRNTQNSVYAENGKVESGQFLLNGSAENASTFLSRFHAEVGPAKGNGFDTYVNGNGPVRSDSFAGIAPQGLGKIALVAIEELHTQLANGNAEAETVLKAIDAYAAVASQAAAERKAAKAKQAIAELAAQAGISPEQVAVLFGKTVAQPIAEVAEVETETAEVEAVA